MAKQYAALLKNPRLGIPVEENATVGARIGTDLRLPDGSVPTLAQLAAALGVTTGSTASAASIASLSRFTVATLPAATGAGRMIYVTDESGGEVPAFSDSAGNWRRVTDRAIVS